jgi:hypothetical protein
MTAIGYVSERFDCYIEQTAPVQNEVLTTAALPVGGRVYGFFVEILAKGNGGGPAHTVLMSIVRDGVATAITAGGAFNFSGASAVSSTAFPSRQAVGSLIGPTTDGGVDLTFSAGHQLRITVAGAGGDSSRLRVHFLCVGSDITNMNVTSTP